MSSSKNRLDNYYREGEAGGSPGDISDSSVMIRPVQFLQY